MNLPRESIADNGTGVPELMAYKRTRITVETEQVLIVRRRGCTRRWCWECGREVDMIGFPQAAVLTGVVPRSLRDYARAEKWHLAETSDGSPLICLESLVTAAKPAQNDSC
jgi:hypothetical protein